MGDMSWLKDAGISGIPALILVVILMIGNKVSDVIKARVAAAPELERIRLERRRAASDADASEAVRLWQRVTTIEAKFDQLAEEHQRALNEHARELMMLAETNRDCERRNLSLARRLTLVCQALTRHDIPVPPEALE